MTTTKEFLPRVDLEVIADDHIIFAHADSKGHRCFSYIAEKEHEAKLKTITEKLWDIRAELEPALTNGDSEGEIGKAIYLLDELLKVAR